VLDACKYKVQAQIKVGLVRIDAVIERKLIHGK